LFDPYEYDMIDWDDEDDEGGNLRHCLAHGVDEAVVAGVLRAEPVEVKLSLVSAEIALVGPDTSWSRMWTILLARSFKRGDWLRPVTGWRSRPAEIRAWEAATGKSWRGQG
jgi:hypothetical protein